MFCTARKYSIIVVSVMSMLLSFCVMDSWICLGFECDVLMLHSLTCCLSTCRLYYAWSSLAVLYNTAHKMPQHVPINSSAILPEQHHPALQSQWNPELQPSLKKKNVVVCICVYINIRIISSICKSSVAFNLSTFISIQTQRPQTQPLSCSRSRVQQEQGIAFHRNAPNLRLARSAPRNIPSRWLRKTPPRKKTPKTKEFC